MTNPATDATGFRDLAREGIRASGFHPLRMTNPAADAAGFRDLAREGIRASGSPPLRTKIGRCAGS